MLPSKYCLDVNRAFLFLTYIITKNVYAIMKIAGKSVRSTTKADFFRQRTGHASA